MTLSISIDDRSVTGLSDAFVCVLRRFAGIDRVGIEAGEVLPFFHLDVPTGDVAEATVDQLTTDTSRLHLQVFSRGTAKYFARANRSSSGGWEVTQLSESFIAGKIDDAITHIYKNGVGDIRSMSLVEVPSRYLTALVLHRGDGPHVLTVSSVDQNAIAEGTLLPWIAFMDSVNKSPQLGLTNL